MSMARSGDSQGSPGLSVVIPTRSKPRQLSLVLAGLMRQLAEREEYEVIIAEYPGTEAVAQMCSFFRGAGLAITHLVCEKPGRSAGRNQGAAVSRGRRLVFLDDDTIPGPMLIREHVRRAPDETMIGLVEYAAPRATMSSANLFGLSTGDVDVDRQLRQFATTSDRDVDVSFIDSYDVLFAAEGQRTIPTWADARGRAGMRELLDSSTNAWNYFLTIHCSVDSLLFGQVGGFDEGLSGWGEEDPEIGYRLSGCGAKFKTAEVPGTLNQLHGPSRNTLGREWLRNYTACVHRHGSVGWMLRWRLVLGLLSFEKSDALIRRCEDDSRLARRIQLKCEGFLSVAQAEGELAAREGRTLTLTRLRAAAATALPDVMEVFDVHGRS